ncbi:GGDEF domain-containing protein [Zoogloea ramigera]|uniref:GGDEF domain-containing protein n=1 Tax=Zoogloea ramigera TaxID=350 RepID=UPI0014773837|nr:GGDEF domain-containing protein [Zoogloea ramigera]
MTTPAKPADVHRTWRAGRVLLALTSVFAAIAVCGVVWLAVDLYAVGVAAGRLQGETVPWTIERQRLGRNLEQLRLEGQRVLTASSPAGRQDALFLVHVLSAQPGMADDPRTASLAAEVERFLQQVEAPATPADMQVWEALSSRLRLMADDLSVEGGKRMGRELGRMSGEMAQASYKLLFNLALMAGFMAAFLLVVRRYLIRPLQRIRRVLSALDPRGPVPAFPPGPMAEIRAVEDAIVRFHATLLENDEVRLRLERLATTDGLTGLFNRHHFMALAADEMARAARYGRPITVGIADLDHFKQVNDTLGHAAGDHVLKTFAMLLGDTLRQTDRVCRYGGEEFAFVLPETTPEEAQLLGERLRTRLLESPPVLPDGRHLSVTFSLGLADASGCGLEESLARADLGLYEAKRAGRNRTVVTRRPDGL